MQIRYLSLFAEREGQILRIVQDRFGWYGKDAFFCYYHFTAVNNSLSPARGLLEVHEQACEQV